MCYNLYWVLEKKKIKEKINDDHEIIYVATHPTRLNILTRLESQKMYASKLEGIVNVDRKIISFHLSKLEKAGLVHSEYGLTASSSTRPMAVRYYSLTTEGEKILRKIKAILSDGTRVCFIDDKDQSKIVKEYQ